MSSAKRANRTKLDYDDVVLVEFLTNINNANAVMDGLKKSNCTIKLGVGQGGTNNGTYVDKELVIFNNDTGRFESSGKTITTIVPAASPVPFATDRVITGAGVNNAIALGVSATTLATQTLAMPAGYKWKWLRCRIQGGAGGILSFV